MKGIALIRVSTDSQDLQQQSDAVINEMIRDGYTKDNIILIEDKESAVLLSEEERQGLTKMKSFIESDKDINSVYVFELSRLSRKPEVLYSIRNYLVEHKIQLVVIKPSIRLFDNGTISESANMMFAIFGAMAEQEGYIRKERMARGRKKSVKDGKYVGGFVPFGYKISDDRRIVINEAEAVIVRKIFNRYAKSNVSMKKIGMELIQSGILHYSNYQDASARVQRILENDRYTGCPFGKLQISYPPIIDKELYERVRQLREERKTQPKTIRKYTSLLQGIIRDGLTKRALVAQPNTSMYSYFLKYADGRRFESSINLNVTDSIAWHLTVNYQKKTNKLLSKQIRENAKKKAKLLSTKIDTAKKKLEDLSERELRIQKRIIAGKMNEKMGDALLQSLYEDVESLNCDIDHWEIERLNLIAYYQMTEMTEDESVIKDLSSITDLEEKKRLISESIKTFDIWQIIDDKRYYKGVVTFANNTSVSFTINTYSKVVRYLDGEKMNYEYRRTVAREQMKPDHFVRKTEGPNIRYNKQQPDSFFP